MADREDPFTYLVTKRLLDFILGSMLFCISLPIIVVAAIAIRIESPGNPFFLQRRIGLHGKPFTIFKLRGMWVDARQRFPGLYNYRKHEDLNFRFHYEHDPRITRVGNLIRRTSIDELPNFLNVLLGNMSLVGPRPEVPEVMALYGDYKDAYVSVKPGVTCLSKVVGRDLLTKENTVRTDIDYINNRSLSLDVNILWRTMCSVMLRRNVFGRGEADAGHALSGRKASGPQEAD